MIVKSSKTVMLISLNARLVGMRVWEGREVLLRCGKCGRRGQAHRRDKKKDLQFRGQSVSSGHNMDISHTRAYVDRLQNVPLNARVFFLIS